MELISIDANNIKKETGYLASIGKLQEFQDKKVEPAQWSAIILFANQQIQKQNQQQNNNARNG